MAKTGMYMTVYTRILAFFKFFFMRQTENSVFGPLISVCLRQKRKCYFPSERDGNK